MANQNHEQHENNSGRRNFLKKAAVAGAASLAVGKAQAAPAAPKKLKLGVFGLDYTFWGLWADLLSPTGRASGTSFLNMEPAYVWDKDQKKAQDFADKWGCEVVKKYDGMVGKVDGVVNGDLYNVPWQHQLFRPYIEAGIPCYLQRPWSSCLRDLDEMLELAAKHNTPIIATATHEHYDVATSFGRKLKSVGQIESVHGVCGAGDRPHCHLPYMMMRILGYNVEQVAFQTNDPKKPKYMQINYVFGETENQPSFCLSMQKSGYYNYLFSIIGKEGCETSSLPAESSYFVRFMPQLIDIQKTIEKKEHFQPLDIVRKKFECVLTEYYSHMERGGAPVKVGSVPSDWQLMMWRPDFFDGSEFKS